MRGIWKWVGLAGVAGVVAGGALVARDQPLVAVLWGRDAGTLKPMLTGERCLTIESVHPSPLSASRG